MEEIQHLEVDPEVLRLNVLKGRRNGVCAFCGLNQITRMLTLKCRVHIFVSKNVYIPPNKMFCQVHFDQNGLLSEELALQFINRPYILKGIELQTFLEALRNAESAKDSTKNFCDENSFSDAEFKILFPISKPQLQDLLTYCDPVPESNYFRYVNKKDLLLFLCKLSQGLSDDLLKLMFNYKSRQAVSRAIDIVRKSLCQRFVPSNIGLRSITRAECIERHVTRFANELYNPTPEIPKAIVFIDGTYTYTHKSSNFQILRKAYSRHKGRHLLKPALMVAPDGYILAVQGPYFSNPPNNDAAMLRNEVQTDPVLTQWFQDEDIIIVDRGYRDVIPLLQTLDISCLMPNFLQRNQKQFTTEEANENRRITKTRWIVEARNGHLKSIFKFLGQTMIVPHLKNLKDFYEIAGALINKYHSPISMENDNPEFARELLRKANVANAVQERVEADRLCRRNGQWEHLTEEHVQDFPRLSLQQLKELTVGTFQVRLANAYVQDKVHRDEDGGFELDMHINEQSFMRVRVNSRHQNAVHHQIFIKYRSTDIEFNAEDLDDFDLDNLILGYYCTCKSGARTLGACAHVTSVIWYLAYARHEPNVKYPPTSLIQVVLDAGRAPDLI